jgi:hypothetical protein
MTTKQKIQEFIMGTKFQELPSDMLGFIGSTYEMFMNASEYLDGFVPKDTLSHLDFDGMKIEIKSSLEDLDCFLCDFTCSSGAIRK